MDYPAYLPPMFLKGGHRQTLLGALPGRCRPRPGVRAEAVDLGGGDRTTLHVYEPETVLPASPTVLLLHGLEGDAHRHYMIRTANKFSDRGFRTARMNMRCCGDAEGLSAGFYNGARSEDVRSACDWIRKQHPKSPLVLVGFSLGANLMLKAAAEASRDDEYAAVVAVSPPIDLHYCARTLVRPHNRFYHRRFVNSLVARARRHLKNYGIPDRFGLSREMTLVEFDSRFTVPMGGFRDVEHYYSTGSTKGLLERIRCPWLIVTAQDDTICPYDMFVDFQSNGTGSLLAPISGGHLGFLSRRNGADSDRRWAENRAVEFVVQRCGGAPAIPMDRWGG